MFLLRAGFRTAARTTRARPFSSTAFKHAPRSRPQYTRFGEDSGQGGQRQQWSNFGPMYRAQYIWRNYQKPIVVIGVGGGAIYVINLEEVPITHRRRFNLLTPEREKQFVEGAKQYEMTLAQFEGKVLPADHQLTRLVARVVERLLPTTGGLAGDEWRVHVIDAPGEKNAFVMPGGKVFVFTGILPICQTEGGVAAVLGHEIAHNVAHHVAERVSSQLFTLMFTLGTSFLLGIDSNSSGQLTELLLSLPNSRTQETEADHIGLLMMAEACYDPREALAFWDRMRKAEQSSPPQFMSTHPSSYNRMDAIKQWLPEAQSKYAEHGCDELRQHAQDFTGTLGRQLPAPAPPRRQVAVQQSRRQEDDDDFF